MNYRIGAMKLCGIKNASPEKVKQGVSRLPHRGFKDTACFELWLATFHIIEMLYDTPYPDIPQTNRVEKPDRNAEIVARYEAGETGASLAETFGISEQRVNQIVRGKRK